MIIIPGELISILTFPGVILHEVAHKFFCDITNVDVYEIYYFKPFASTAGHVIHAPTKNIYKMFLIAIAPLIINSVVCMLLTFPHGATHFLGTDNIEYDLDLLFWIYLIIGWMGYSIGFHAIPSNQDMSNLVEMAESRIAKSILYILTKIIYIFNINYLGFFFTGLYTLALAQLLPYLFLR